MNVNLKSQTYFKSISNTTLKITWFECIVILFFEKLCENNCIKYDN